MSEPDLSIWRIRSGAVGSVELGKAVPGHLLDEELERRYRSHYYADAQPWEGFEFDQPPVTVGITGGPLAEQDPMQPREPDALASAAAAAARAGAPVSSILIHAAGPATDSGIAVDSTLSDLRRAYPDLRLQSIPPTFGDDRCVASTATLPGVYFLFSSCDDAESGAAIIRIELRSDD